MEEIDFIRFTPNDDTFYANSISTNNIYDFISGEDKVIYRSADLPSKLTNLINLDNFIWESDSNPEAVESYEFSVNYINEDSVDNILIEKYDSNNLNEKLFDQLKIDFFNQVNTSSDQDLSWLDIELVDPTPEIINQGKPVIQKQFVQDSEISDLFWLEIHFYDYRSFGKGFIGADIDIEWDTDSIILDTDLYNFDNVFGIEKFPIFQNLGDIDISDQVGNISSIKGITAGSLPVASQGVLLGEMQSDNVYTKNLPEFHLEILTSLMYPILTLTLNSLPASKAISVEKSDVIVIDEHSPKALVLRTSPEQENIGTHYIKVISTDEYDFDQQNVVINVNSINDSPVPLGFDNETNPLKVDLFQNENYIQDLSSLFTDEDNLNLIYEIVSAPDWVSFIDENTLSGNTQK